MTRMIIRMSIALLATLALLACVAGAASAQPRPTFSESHRAVHYVLDDYAELVSGHLVVGPCARKGRRSVVCRARIDGPSPERYRIVVSPQPRGRMWSIWARALR